MLFDKFKGQRLAEGLLIEGSGGLCMVEGLGFRAKFTLEGVGVGLQHCCKFCLRGEP